MLSLPKHPSSPATALQLQRLLFRVAGNVIRALRVILPLLLLTLAPRLHAQDTPLWRYATTEDISFYRLTPLGDLAVATGDKLTALDAATGEELWSRTDLADLREGAFEVIPLTPYGVVRSNDGMALIDLTSGATLWDSTSVPLRVRGYFVILPHEMMLLYGETAESDKTLMAVDLETGALLWRQDRLLEEKPPLEKIDGIHTFAGHQLPLLDTDSTMIVFISKDGPLKIHVGTGELVWRVPGFYPPLLREGHAPMQLAGDTLFVSGRNKGLLGIHGPPWLMAINTSDGAMIWANDFRPVDKPLAILGELLLNNPTPEGQQPQVAEMKLVSLYDRFHAALKAKGFTAERDPEDPTGWLINGVEPVSQSTRRAIRDLLRHVDQFPEGLLVRSEPHKGKQLMSLLDAETGQAIWSRTVPTEKAAPSFLVENRVFVAEHDGLLAVDLNTGISGVITPFESYGFEGCQPAVLEQVPNGLLLRSDQALMMLDTRGAVRFNRSYGNGCGSETLRDVGKIVGVLASLGGVVVSSLSNSHVCPAAGGGLTMCMNADPSEIDPWLLDFSWLQKLDQKIVQRFEAPLGLGKYAFMSDKDGNAYSIVKVRKTDGEEIDRLRLGKKSQDHIVDGISGTVFVHADEREIMAFRFPAE